MNLVFHPDARIELTDAARYYKEKSSELGSKFLDAFERSIRVIQEAPECWTIVDGDVRHYLMRRFPYAIFYRVHTEHLRILALKHHSRHPDYWRYRLTD